MVEAKKFFLSHQPSIFQEHAAQRCQSRKPKGCGNGKRRAKLGNRLGKSNIHLIFSTACLFLIVVLMFGGIFQSYAADLQMFSNAKLINNSANDGDSFLVEVNGKSFRVRVYILLTVLKPLLTLGVMRSGFGNRHDILD